MSFKARMSKAIKKGDTLYYVGAGSTRAVYKMDFEGATYAVKFAHSSSTSCNKKEFETAEAILDTGLIPNYVARAEDYQWIACEFVEAFESKNTTLYEIVHEVYYEKCKEHPGFLRGNIEYQYGYVEDIFESDVVAKQKERSKELVALSTKIHNLDDFLHFRKDFPAVCDLYLYNLYEENGCIKIVDLGT